MLNDEKPICCRGKSDRHDVANRGYASLDSGGLVCKVIWKSRPYGIYFKPQVGIASVDRRRAKSLAVKKRLKNF